MTAIFWFRQDLRLSDNLGLINASQSGPILPVYIIKPDKVSAMTVTRASQVYLYHSLLQLNQSLNNHLNIYVGDPKEIIFQLIKKFSITQVFWNHCYEPWHLSDDRFIQKKLAELTISYAVFHSSYLWNPAEIKNTAGAYYKVFTAFKKKVSGLAPRQPLPAPKNIIAIKDPTNQHLLDKLLSISQQPQTWQNKISQQWTFGEIAAQKKLAHFLDHGLSGYQKARNYPALDQTSKLSVNLHFGEISPHQIWSSVNNNNEDSHCFLNEMIWREFSCYLLAYFNQLPVDNFQTKFDHFPWTQDLALLDAWQKGNTGYPLVDAGMRQLWQTGYMHNRVRMVVASFLVKNLLIHWHDGQQWFWDCLVDADLANNSASWQWVAGCGADAAPYFRIFNPITQAEKFDPYGQYIKQFLPELEQLPLKYIFKPWEAPEKVLTNAHITLGINYPKPIINLQITREKALSAYQALKYHKILDQSC